MVVAVLKAAEDIDEVSTMDLTVEVTNDFLDLGVVVSVDFDFGVVTKFLLLLFWGRLDRGVDSEIGFTDDDGDGEGVVETDFLRNVRFGLDRGVSVVFEFSVLSKFRILTLSGILDFTDSFDSRFGATDGSTFDR